MNEELYLNLVNELCTKYNTWSFYRGDQGIVLNMAHFSLRPKGPYQFVRHDETFYLPFTYKGHRIIEQW